jgi:hypothetical protein
MRVRALALTAIALAMPACTQPEATTPETVQQALSIGAAPDSVRDQVLAVVEQYYADLTAREWDLVRGHFWPGATLTTIWQLAGEPAERVINTTIESFIEQAPLGPGSRAIFSETMTAANVLGNTDLAQVWASYDARFGDPDAVQEWSGVDAFTLLRFDGRWRIASIAYVSTDGGGPQ